MGLFTSEDHAASLIDTSVLEIPVAWLDDKIGERLHGVPLIEVHPFLDLSLEAGRCDLLDPEGGWMRTISGERTQDNDRRLLVGLPEADWSPVVIEFEVAPFKLFLIRAAVRLPNSHVCDSLEFVVDLVVQ